MRIIESSSRTTFSKFMLQCNCRIIFVLRLIEIPARNSTPPYQIGPPVFKMTCIRDYLPTYGVIGYQRTTIGDNIRDNVASGPWQRNDTTE
jgi:hypothetical protein